MNNIKNAQKMIQTINNKLDKIEHQTSTLKGVKNLSRADLEMAQLYAHNFIRNSGASFSPFIEPTGEIKTLLEKFSVIA